MKKNSYQLDKFIKGNISLVRDGLSSYVKVSSVQPVLITERGLPKSVIVDFEKYLEIIAEKLPKKSIRTRKIKSNKFTNFRDFFYDESFPKKKINLKKAIEDAWTQGY